MGDALDDAIGRSGGPLHDASEGCVDGAMSSPEKMTQIRHRKGLDADYPEKALTVLESAISELYSREDGSNRLDFLELHRNVHNMMLHKFGDMLHIRLVSSLSRQLRYISASLSSAQGVVLLFELNLKWVHHKSCVDTISGIFSEMDENYVHTHHKASVNQLGLILWKENVINCRKIQIKILKELLNLIQRERNGGIADTRLIRNTVNMLTELGSSVYEEVFEKPFLTDSALYYRGQSQHYFAQYDCSEYLKNVEILLKEEKQRISYYLDADTTVKIENVIEHEMIAKQQIKLVQMENSGLNNMLMEEKYEDLCRMYDLFRKVPDGLSTMSDCLATCVNSVGQLLVCELKSSDEHVKFIESFLSMKNKYEKIISIGFQNDKSFEKMLSSLVRNFIVNIERFSEIVSLYVDDRISHNWQGLREEAIEVIMDNVMMLFRHLPEKDMFHNYYKQHLAKRLISIDLVSVDAERRMLLKLKIECGEKFVSDFEKMLIDFENSVHITNDFDASRPSDTQDGPKLGVKLLRTGLWPIKSEEICSLPAEAIGLCDNFVDYYHQIHGQTNEKRKLTWQPSMGDADLNATFSNGRKYELSVSAYQMCILMQFNNAEFLTYTELEQATKIPAPDLKICLQSLSCVAGKNVLGKEPMSEDVREDDVFFFNSKFSSESYKVFLGSAVTNKESEPEKKKSKAGVIERRMSAIDAAVVRIMKSKKYLKLNRIVRKVEKKLQDHFPTDTSLVKSRIDILIEKEYIKISDSDPTLYEYIP